MVFGHHIGAKDSKNKNLKEGTDEQFLLLQLIGRLTFNYYLHFTSRHQTDGKVYKELKTPQSLTELYEINKTYHKICWEIRMNLYEGCERNRWEWEC